jgi:hypothetical protein
LADEDRVAAGPEHDPDLPFIEEPKRAHHVVGALDQVVDVLDAGVVGWEHCDRVVYFVDAQKRCIADAIAHARIADLRPERLVARGVRGAQADVAEAGDAGVAGSMIARAAMGGPPHQFDPVTGRVIERDKLAHFASFRLTWRAGVNRVSEQFQLACGG